MAPVNITFRHMSPSLALSDEIRAQAAKLEKFYDHIIRCDVVVDGPPHKQEHSAEVFSVRIDLAVPGQDICVHRTPADQKAEEDVYVTVNQAFHTLRRRLEDFARIQHGHVKSHTRTAPTVPS